MILLAKKDFKAESALKFSGRPRPINYSSGGAKKFLWTGTGSRKAGPKRSGGTLASETTVSQALRGSVPVRHNDHFPRKNA